MENSKKVTEHIAKLPAGEAEVVNYLREQILEADAEISEHIKWNSPAFYYSGEMAEFDATEYKRDILVMNIRPGRILLVLPTGATIQGDSGILEGKYTDGRRMITIKDLDDAQQKAGGIKTVLRKWLEMVEK
jgi:hypothetical protein